MLGRERGESRKAKGMVGGGSVCKGEMGREEEGVSTYILRYLLKNEDD
jgi:hypothetical protein